MNATDPSPLDRAKAAVSIAECWRALGVAGEPPRPGSACRSPLREDRKPSWSITPDGRRWTDHATGDGGSVVDFIAAIKECSDRDAIRILCQLAGVPLGRPGGRGNGLAAFSGPSMAERRAARERRDRVAQEREAVKIESSKQAVAEVVAKSHLGTDRDHQRLADLRKLPVDAIRAASATGFLIYGRKCGFPCWMLTDPVGGCAEARRMDGKKFPALGSLAARKGHAPKGTRKPWPLGLSAIRPEHRIVLLLEGAPDWLAAHALITAANRTDILPVAMLGASTRISTDALTHFAGKRVRILPHCDNAGINAAMERWGQPLADAGADADMLDLRELGAADGDDLNDILSRSPREAIRAALPSILPD